MRVWLDIVTPKQIRFFQPVIDSLRKDGHEVLATSRRYREVDQLASSLGLELSFAGSRAPGREPLAQFQHSLERMEQLLPLVVDFSPVVSVSVASSECARTSFALKVKHVAVNDSPHSVIAGKLSLPLSYHVMTPWIIPYGAWTGFGVSRRQITRYRALDPAAWLKRRRTTPRAKARRSDSATILVRLEESYAPYLAGTDDSWADSLLERIAHDFGGQRLIALCRYEDQLAHVKKRFGSSFEVPERTVDGAAMIEQSDVFVGMGGTMTAEAALLGVPSVSAFQGPELYTENYLLSKSLLLKARSAAAVSMCIRRSLDPVYSKSYHARARALLDWMEDPAARVARYVGTLSAA